jgi:MFS family permease
MLESLLTVMQDSDKSALRLLLAIFFWFLGYTAIEAFFTLYAKNHLGLEVSDGARLLGQLSLIFVIFALPSGYIGGKFGRRVTIVSGIVLMSLTMLAMFFVPPATLTIQLTKLPVLGVVPVLGVLLMTAGAAWALININSPTVRCFAPPPAVPRSLYRPVWSCRNRVLGLSASPAHL